MPPEKKRRPAFLPTGLKHRGNTLRCFFASWVRRLPAGLALAGILAGILPHLLAGPETPPGGPWFAAGAIGFTLIAWLCLPLRDALFRAALPALAGLIAVWLYSQSIRTDPLLEECGRGNARLEAILRVDDPSASPGTAVWLPPPKNLRCRVEAIREPGTNVWRPLCARVLLRKTGPPDAAYMPGFGDRLEAELLLIRPNRPRIRGTFDYAEYLGRQGIHYLARTGSVRTLERGTGIRRGLFDLRDAVLDRLCGELEPEDARLLAPGILFGIRQGVDPAVKQEFMRSGMVHLLSVSGTHVMIFAGFLLILLGFLPLRMRYTIAIGLCFLYALATGLGTPALRAFLMFAVLFGLRAFLHRSIGMNTLFFSAAVLLLLNPGDLLNPGFQYSFLTVGALIGAADAVRTTVLTAPAKLRWVPGKYRTDSMRYRERMRQWLWGGLAGCTVAFLASAALNLRYQGIFPAGSAAANFLCLPLIGLLFPVFFAGMLFGIVPGVTAAASWLIGTILRAVIAVNSQFADFSLAPGTPPEWTVWTFLIVFGLLLALTAERPRIAAGCLCILATIIVGWHLRPKFLDPELAVFTGSDRGCAAVFTDPGMDYAAAAGPLDADTARDIAAYLAQRGIGSCKLALVPDTTKDTLEGLARLAGTCGLDAVAGPERLRKKLRGIMPDTVLSHRTGGGPCVFFESARLKSCQWDDMFYLELRHGPGESLCRLRERPGGTTEVRVSDGPAGIIREERIFPRGGPMGLTTLNLNTDGAKQ